MLATLAAAIALAAAAALLLVSAGTARAAPQTCPNTFHVLHNDHIGKLRLPAGHYTISVLDNRKLNCARASSLFTKFLEDFDGNLPGRWKVHAGQKLFRKGGSNVGFSVAKGSHHGHGGGHHPSGNGTKCPDTFRVLHNDQIGKLKLPAGNYWIFRLNKASPSCSRASQLFTKFLQDTSGDLPSGWRLHVGSASFTRRSSQRGFRVKPVR
jgi:hypothetical protein